MAIHEFIGAFFGGMQTESGFERLKREAREAMYKGFDAGWENLGRDHEEPIGNHFRERTIYHNDGSRTVFRNYAIIKTDERTYKAPLLDPEGRLIQIGS